MGHLLGSQSVQTSATQGVRVGYVRLERGRGAVLASWVGWEHTPVVGDTRAIRVVIATAECVRAVPGAACGVVDREALCDKLAAVRVGHVAG